MDSKTLRLSALLAVLVTAALLIGFIVGAIDAEQFQSTLGKALAVIGVIALTALATTVLGNMGRRQ